MRVTGMHSAQRATAKSGGLRGLQGTKCLLNSVSYLRAHASAKFESLSLRQFAVSGRLRMFRTAEIAP